MKVSRVVLSAAMSLFFLATTPSAWAQHGPAPSLKLGSAPDSPSMELQPVAPPRAAAETAATPGDGTPIPLETVYQMVVDDAHQHVFITGGQYFSIVVVMNFDGSIDTTIDGISGASGMALDEESGTLYVASQNTSQIAVVDTATLTVGTWIPTGAAKTPLNLVLVGSRLWISYKDKYETPGIASLNLTDLAIRRYSMAAGNAPAVLVSNPVNPKLLYAGQHSVNPANLFEFDLTGGALTPIDEVEGGDWAFGQLMAVPDGSELLMGGPPGIVSRSPLDLAPDSLQYPLPNGPGAIAVTPDSAFVAALTGESPNLYVFPARSTKPVSTFTVGSGSALDHNNGYPRALALSADGQELFVPIQSIETYQPIFHVVYDPTLVQSTVALQASPSNLVPGNPTTLSGSLRFGDGASPAGVPIHLTRTNQRGSVKTLPDQVTDASGQFSTTDTPTVAGSYKYTASFDGDGTHGRAKATFMVNAQWPPGALTISRSPSRVPYHGYVTVTARLADPASTPNTIVRITEKPAGRWVTKSGTIDAAGSVSMTFRLSTNSTFFASWSGDATHSKTTSPDTALVEVGSVTAEILKNFYGMSGRFHLYRYSSNCVATHKKGCPHALITVIPSNPLQRICATLQEHVSGHWTTTNKVCGGLTAGSQQTLYIYYGGRGIIGIPLRSRTRFMGSTTNLPSHSSWAYLKVTK